MRSALARGLALSAALLFIACGDTPVEECGPGTGVDCPSRDEIIAGVNLTDLFATPSRSEIDAAYASLASGEGNRSFVVEAQVDLGGRETVTVLRASVGGTAGAFLGAVRQPPRPTGDQRQRPIVLFLADDPVLAPESAIATFPLVPRLRDDVVIVFGVRRGGTLRVGGQTFQSAASGVAPFDPAHSADMLALLDYVRERAATFNVAPDRIGIIGHGAGGTAGLLTGARTNADDYILSLAAPTSFFAPSVLDAARGYLRNNRPVLFPGLTSVLDSTVGRVRDGSLSLPEARAALLVRSPAALVPPPPSARPLAFIFAAHGGLDYEVPEDHLGVLRPLIPGSSGLLFSVPEATHDSILQSEDVLSTGAIFACEYLFPDNPNCF